MKNRAIVWFRQDLRVHDNEAIFNALKNADEIIPVYVFDTRIFEGKTRFGFPKTGKFRAKFIIESIKALRNSLRSLGSDLIVRVGEPEKEIFEIARNYRTSWIFCNRERTYEEVQVQDNLEKMLWEIGQEIIYSRGKMLYYTQDLPFPISQSPDSFTQFRKEVEKFIAIREPLPTPTSLSPLTINVDVGTIPELSDFGYEAFDTDGRAAIPFKGGEPEGLRRLRTYIWENEFIRTYETTKDHLIGEGYSSKLSPWLAQGCISPKMIYQELKKYTEQRGKNKSTGLLFQSLLWRDFLRLQGKKHKNKIFLKGGSKEDPDPTLKNDFQLLRLWTCGRTGLPLVDSNMRELNATGYMSNKGRQIVASFLVHDLQVNWQMGAEYFESLLLDYDPCSNWGNWNYIAGISSDPKDTRSLNILSQARRFDPQGEYVKKWLPELELVPAAKIHQPDTLSTEEQETLSITLGADYPKAMVSTSKWS